MNDESSRSLYKYTKKGKPPPPKAKSKLSADSPCTLPFLAFFMLPLRGLEKMDFHPLTGDFFPLLASLLDFFLSWETLLLFAYLFNKDLID